MNILYVENIKTHIFIKENTLKQNKKKLIVINYNMYVNKLNISKIINGECPIPYKKKCIVTAYKINKK